MIYTKIIIFILCIWSW